MIGNKKIIITTALFLCFNTFIIAQNMGEPVFVKSGDENIDSEKAGIEAYLKS